MNSTKSTGNFGEDLAAEFLSEKGYKIVDRNYRTKFGEIDIIVRKGTELRFVEVKTRELSEDTAFLPEHNITLRKQAKLMKLCEFYLTSKRLLAHQRWQIDVIAITIDKSSGKNKINHIENAVWESRY